MTDSKIQTRIQEIVQIGDQFDDDGAAFDECFRRMQEHLDSLMLGVQTDRTQTEYAAIELSHRYIDDWNEGDDPDPTTIEFVETVKETIPEDEDIDYESYHNEYQQQMSERGVDIEDIECL